MPLWVFYGASVFASSIVIGSLVVGGSSLPLAVQLPLAALTVLPWVPGVRQEFLSLLFVGLSLAPTFLLTWSGGSPLLYGLLAMAVARVAVSATLAQSIAYCAAAIAMVVGRQFVAGHSLDWWMWKTYVELGFALGWAVRSQRLMIVHAREAADEHAQLAALEERRRIARDVHDVLAHTLTILMVHLNSARMSVREDPEGTAELLDEVADYGRHCLVEIRRTVGLLSGAPREPGGSGPIEAANAIEELVGSYRKAGMDVELRLDVEMANLSRLAQAPPAVWSAGYRIVQEALANATKHAPGSAVVVTIFVDDLGLHLRCINAIDATVTVLELPSGGHGIRGMRERVDALGGTLSAGLEDEVWVVRADLPLNTAVVDDAQPASLGRAS